MYKKLSTGFNTEDGSGRAAIVVRFFCLDKVSVVSIPRTVAGGLQSPAGSMDKYNPGGFNTEDGSGRAAMEKAAACTDSRPSFQYRGR